MKPLILPYFDKKPIISEQAFIAPGAAIIGEVSIADGCGIWFNCVIRGDVAYITIGKDTNVQDGTVIHVTRGGHPTIIGSRVTIGHKCLLHACTLEDESFIGMGSTIMDGAVVESGGFVAAGSLVTNKKVIKKGELWAGAPAKFLRHLTPEESKHILKSADNYRKHVDEYLQIMQELRS